jgi:hypothetical protein
MAIKRQRGIFSLSITPLLAKQERKDRLKGGELG